MSRLGIETNVSSGSCSKASEGFPTLTDRSSCLDNPEGWNGVETRGWTRACRAARASINAFPSAPVVIPRDLNSSNIGRCLINGLSENRPLVRRDSFRGDINSRGWFNEGQCWSTWWRMLLVDEVRSCINILTLTHLRRYFGRSCSSTVNKSIMFEREIINLYQEKMRKNHFNYTVKIFLILIFSTYNPKCILYFFKCNWKLTVKNIWF